MAVDPLLQSLVSGFVGEAEELSRAVTRSVLELERAAPSETPTRFEEMARALHTLKGSAATLGLEDLASLAHALEDLVLPLRDSQSPLESSVTDGLLGGLDVFMTRLRLHGAGRSSELQPIASVMPGLLKASARGDLPGEARPKTTAAAAAATQSPPASTSLDEETVQDGSIRVRMSDVVVLFRDIERLREVKLRLDARRRDLDAVIGALSKPGVVSDGGDARAALTATASALSRESEEVAEVIAALEEQVKGLCTLPVRATVEPLVRTVRDLCRAVGKEARLSIVGGEVSLDRRLLEELKGPLQHLVRNAVDHGIEKPEVREARGKNREGALVLRVEQQGNLVFFEISDDGNGLDVDRIREAALRRGMHTEDELGRMSVAQLQQLIFRAGFSTREGVSEVSGRGVGLDVVRNRVQALQGQLEVHSTPGQGTRFVLTVPSEVGSSPMLLVRVGELVIGMPLAAVESLLEAKDRVRSAGEELRLEHQDQLLPLVDLGVLLRLRGYTTPSTKQPVMIVQAQGKRLAVWVDAIVADTEVVIRPLPAEVRGVEAFQGAATLADGELAPVLRPDWLAGAASAAIVAPRGRRALVVDDSLTARTLHRALLEAGGFAVHTAPDGRRALELLSSTEYDAVVCDVAMEPMSGLELARMLRSRSATRGVALVLISGRDGTNAREEAMAAGADAFLSKAECAAGKLLAAVETVVSRGARR